MNVPITDDRDRGAFQTEKAEHEQYEKLAVEGDDVPKNPSWNSRAVAFCWEHEFLISIVAAIALARADPNLGKYLHPEITATWLAVVFIFVLAGLGLKTEEFKKAFSNLKFNLFVQVFSFFVVSSLVFVVTRGLEAVGLLNRDLADGMVICASLPMAINLVIVTTNVAGGDNAAALFNSAAGNLVGVFLSPLLILGYLGVRGDVDLVNVFSKLAVRVVLPVAAGQFLQHISAVKAFVKKHKDSLKRTQQYCLVFIVYTIFCQTFHDGSDSSIGAIFLMIAFQFLLLTTVMVVAWNALKALFPDEPKLRVMGLFGCTFKTMAMGVPLINAIYEGNPAAGLYTLPLLIWHPTQLILGTLLAPHLVSFVQREQKRLGIVEDGDSTAVTETTALLYHQKQAKEGSTTGIPPDIEASSARP